ncbi:MAG: hypothetical protein AAFO79_12150, partial [Pseudomonadota bacterium]
MGAKRMGTANKIAVIAPTTGGLVQINGLKLRPRLQHSYVTMAGDFRPLGISADYHRLVAGPMAAEGLLAEVADGGRHVYELSLSGDIDSGRSWELPTLVAHLAHADGRLVPVAMEGLEPAEVTLIWATGMVDPDLAPQTGDYAIATKTALSGAPLGSHRAAGGDVEVIVSSALPVGDLQHLRAWCADNGFQLTTVDDLADLQAALGVV